MALELDTALINSRLDEITTAIDAGAGAGKLNIYDGTRPAKGGAVTTLLAELTFSDPSSAAAAAGVLTANSINQDASANATGTATWFRVTDSDDNFILDGDVGTSGSDLNLNTVAIVIAQPVSVTAFAITGANL